MSVITSIRLSAFAMGLLLALSPPAFAQPAPPAPKQQRQAEQLKQFLDVSDDEWKVLEPKIEKILTLQRERERFIGKPKVPKAAKSQKPDAADNPAPPTSGLRGIEIKTQSKADAAAGTTNARLAEAFGKLVEMASDGNTGADELAAALREFHSAQSKSDAELAKARSQLRELVTVKQEVVLVVLKVLD